MSFAEDLENLDAAIQRHFGQGVDPQWPGGYPGEIEAALIDAVFSIRARYGRTPDTGVRAVVGRWRSAQGTRSLDDLLALAEPEGVAFAEVAGNNTKTGGSRKYDAVVAAARAMVDSGVRHAGDLDNPELFAAAKWAYRGTPGLGPVTWSYFAMLLGKPDVKADTHVITFVSEAVNGDRKRLGWEYVRDLLHASVNPVGTLTELDHAIWRYQRSL